MAYTDLELRLATEIAYLDLHLVEDYADLTEGTGNMTVEEAIQLILKINDRNLSAEEIKRYEGVLADFEKLKKMKEDAGETFQPWSITDIHNDNGAGQSGFYGMVLDTGNGHIVAFRGSENITDHQHVKQDWVGADLALMNSINQAARTSKSIFGENQ